ncbi:MAG: hypothetical protein WDO73_02335 [Ignavibacteriota bacterium]
MAMDHFRLCREAIYNLHASRVSPDYRAVFTALQLNLRRRALLVFFTSLDDAAARRNFRTRSSDSGAPPSGAGQHTATAGPEAAICRRVGSGSRFALCGPRRPVVTNRLRQLALSLSNRGVRLSVVDPRRIKTQVTSEYLEVKRRQVL